MARRIHAVAFSESVDQTLDNITPVADGLLRVSGDDLFASPELPFLAGFYAGGASMERARLVTNLLRSRVLLDFQPVDTDADPGELPQYHDMRSGPRQIIDPQAAALEAINVQIENDAAAAATDASALLLLTDSQAPILPVAVPPDVYPVRFTGTDTPAAEVWDDLSITLAQTLRSGVYDLWNVRLQGATAKFWRVVPNMPSEADAKGVWRPGGLACNGDTEFNVTQDPGFFGGPIARFRSDNVPTLQYLCDSAAAQSPQGVLWVRRVA